MPRKVFIIAGSVFLMASGYFLAIPLFSTLALEKGFGLNQGAFLIGAFILAHKGCGVLFGPLADYWGHKRLAVLGELLRGVGLVLLVFMPDFPSLLIMSFVSGLGGGMSSPALNALIMFSVPQKYRLQVSSLRSIANNSGTLIGPLLAGLIILWGDLSTTFITAGIFYLIASASLLFIKTNRPSTPSPKQKISYVAPLYNRPFMLIIIFLFGFWLLYAQLFVSIPDLLLHFTKQVETIFILNGILGITLQYPISKWIISRGLMNAYSLGTLTFIASFLALFLFPNWLGVYISVIMITFGEMFILPTTDLLITNATNENHAASFFAIKNLADSLGRPSGSIIGGFLFGEWFPDNNIGWLIMVMISFSLFLYHYLFLKSDLEKNKEILIVS